MPDRARAMLIYYFCKHYLILVSVDTSRPASIRHGVTFVDYGHISSSIDGTAQQQQQWWWVPRDWQIGMVPARLGVLRSSVKSTPRFAK